MKIKKVFSEKSYEIDGINFQDEKVTIKMNGEEFNKLMIALATAKLSKIVYAKEIYYKLADCKHECEWKD